MDVKEKNIPIIGLLLGIIGLIVLAKAPSSNDNLILLGKASTIIATILGVFSFFASKSMKVFALITLVVCGFAYNFMYELSPENIHKRQALEEEAKIPKYTIRFINEGESFYKTTVKKGNKLEPPEDIPTKTGYRFLYWTDSVQNLLPFDFNTPITKDLMLFAHYEVDF